MKNKIEITIIRINIPWLNYIAFIIGCYLIGTYFQSQELGLGIFLLGSAYFGQAR